VATLTPAPSPFQPTFTPAAENPLLASGAFVGEDIIVNGGAVDLASYMAVAEGDVKRPAVIVIHENTGLTPFIRDVVDGLASSGYLAIPPDLLSHEGGTANAGNVSNVLRGVSMDRHVSDVDAIVRYLQSQRNVGEIGIIGFCFGGGVVWSSVARVDGIAAAESFYGSNPPIDQVPNITAAVVGYTESWTVASTRASPPSPPPSRPQAPPTNWRSTPTLPTHS
jgi:carboxymethylenebutenolidase